MTLAVLGLVSGCASSPPAGAPRADQPEWPGVGSTWTFEGTTTGGPFAGTERFVVRFLGPRTHRGARSFAFELPQTLFLVDERWRVLERVWPASNETYERWEPNHTLFDWPLWVGKWWRHTYRYTHRDGRSFDNVPITMSVDAHEEVATRAGTFRAFRVTHDDPGYAATLWWSPEVRMIVRLRAQLKPGHPGGTHQHMLELLRYELKP